MSAAPRMQSLFGIIKFQIGATLTRRETESYLSSTQFLPSGGGC